MSINRKHHWFVAAALLVGVAVGGVRLVGAAGGTATSVVPVEPYRILDTRNGIGAPASPVGAGRTIDVQIAGVGPVPADAVGIVLNITGTRTTEATYITAWPTGTAQPTASVLNITPGIDAPNGVTALLGAGGKLSLFNFTGSTDLIADVAGYLVAGGSGGQGPQGPQGPKGADGVSGYTKVFAAGTVAAGTSYGDFTVACPVGKVPVGGGAWTNGISALVLRISMPTTNGWTVRYGTPDSSDVVAVGGVAVQTWVVCVTAT